MGLVGPDGRSDFALCYTQVAAFGRRRHGSKFRISFMKDRWAGGGVKLDGLNGEVVYYDFLGMFRC